MIEGKVKGEISVVTPTFFAKSLDIDAALDDIDPRHEGQLPGLFLDDGRLPAAVFRSIVIVFLCSVNRQYLTLNQWSHMHKYKDIPAQACGGFD